MLLGEREYPVKAIFNLISHRFGKIFRKWYAANNSRTPFIPIVEKILQENMTEGDKLYVNNINGSTDEFTVLGYGPSAKVNLSRRSCSCSKFDLVKFPCSHAMVVLHLKHGDDYGTSFYNYSSPIYSKESYLLAYLKPIFAVPLKSEWSMVREYLEMAMPLINGGWIGSSGEWHNIELLWLRSDLDLLFQVLSLINDDWIGSSIK
ncbi:hypothetical protein BC332_02907 [Capsicum chinense]|nr:hypothetical protein BC332_02907 [Capsicum chinense]